MDIRKQIEELEFIKNDILVKRFGNNIHDLDLTETVETGIVNRLLNARELGIDYAVVIGGVASATISNPLRSVITTYDIATVNNDREQERKNIYAFLRGDIKSIKSVSEFEPYISKVGRAKK